ncbi:MAG: hypothetical protein JWL61_3931 [Gemmatimonadetes bacterium]|nr:hypothetical protein [Gemmatimonadota bacterium]
MSNEALQGASDELLLTWRMRLDVELRRRGISIAIGDIGERLAIAHFRSTSGLPNLQLAPRGTKNIDALSRDGERYSIKSVCHGKKTGTIYPDSSDPEKQLFEYLLIVQLGKDWALVSIHSLSWEVFRDVRSWDKRMNAWYVALSRRTLAAAKEVIVSPADANA